MGNTTWRPAPTSCATLGDDLSVGEKFQSSLAIAGSLRNSLRASVLRISIRGVELLDEIPRASVGLSTKLRILVIPSKAVSTTGLSS